MTPLAPWLDAELEQRRAASEELFGAHADALATLCHRMAERFARGGRLIALGVSPAARTDVEHVVVEFVHPVIVGKRALPAFGLTGAKAALRAEAALHVRADDIVIAFADADASELDVPGTRSAKQQELVAARARPAEHEELVAAVAASRAAGALTVAFSPLGAEHELPLEALPGPITQELGEVTYHVLWELVHVFFEHRGLLSGRTAKPVHDSGPSAFLYPFLAEQESDLQTVLADVAGSAAIKGAEAHELRARTVRDGADALIGGAELIRSALNRGGRVLTFGNGGSCTDAADLAVDFQAPVAAGPARPALDLTDSSALLTALANDIGVEALLSRQLIAHAGEEDVLVVFSTSGGSQNLLSGLAEARRRRLATVAFVGYDGGPILDEGLADRVIISRSQHIPRIQEAHATAYHLLRELVEMVPG